MQQHLERLNDTDTRARIEAMAAFYGGGDAALTALLTGLAHPSLESRWRSAAALGWMHDDRAIDALAAVFAHEGYEVTINAAWALGEIGSPAAVEVLLQVVHAGDHIFADVRYVAALALARMGQSDRLRDSLSDKPEAVYRVAHAALAAYHYI